MTYKKQCIDRCIKAKDLIQKIDSICNNLIKNELTLQQYWSKEKELNILYYKLCLIMDAIEQLETHKYIEED